MTQGPSFHVRQLKAEDEHTLAKLKEEGRILGTAELVAYTADNGQAAMMVFDRGIDSGSNGQLARLLGVAYRLYRDRGRARKHFRP